MAVANSDELGNNGVCMREDMTFAKSIAAECGSHPAGEAIMRIRRAVTCYAGRADSLTRYKADLGTLDRSGYLTECLRGLLSRFLQTRARQSLVLRQKLRPCEKRHGLV